METEGRLVVARGLEEDRMGEVMSKGHGVFFWGDENVLELMW